MASSARWPAGDRAQIRPSRSQGQRFPRAVANVVRCRTQSPQAKVKAVGCRLGPTATSQRGAARADRSRGHPILRLLSARVNFDPRLGTIPRSRVRSMKIATIGPCYGAGGPVSRYGSHRYRAAVDWPRSWSTRLTMARHKAQSANAKGDNLIQISTMRGADEKDVTPLKTCGGHPLSRPVTQD